MYISLEASNYIEIIISFIISAIKFLNTKFFFREFVTISLLWDLCLILDFFYFILFFFK